MSIYDKGLITILGISLLLIVVAVPLALRKVPRNVIYGFRTRATMSSDVLWYSANAHAGRGLILASLCGAIVAVVIYMLRPVSPEAFITISVLIMVVPNLIATLATLRYIRTLQRSSKQQGDR